MTKANSSTSKLLVVSAICIPMTSVTNPAEANTTSLKPSFNRAPIINPSKEPIITARLFTYVAIMAGSIIGLALL